MSGLRTATIDDLKKDIAIARRLENSLAAFVVEALEALIEAREEAAQKVEKCARLCEEEADKNDDAAESHGMRHCAGVIREKGLKGTV